MSKVCIVFGKIAKFENLDVPVVRSHGECHLILLEDKKYEGNDDNGCTNILTDQLDTTSITTVLLYLHESSKANNSQSQITLAKRLLNTQEKKPIIKFFSHISSDDSFSKLSSIIRNVEELPNLFQEDEKEYLVKLVDKLAVRLILKELQPGVITSNDMDDSISEVFNHRPESASLNLTQFYRMDSAAKLSTLATDFLRGPP